MACAHGSDGQPPRLHEIRRGVGDALKKAG
jgi:hypothetical protein